MAKKILLDESEIPERWYNILPDLPGPPAPYLHPATLQPMGPADLAPIFPEAIIAQEVSAEPWIEIPDEVREVYKIWRPSPVYRAERLEKALDTPAKIYFKYEGVSPAGSHKPNTAVPQAYYNAKEGVKRLTTETGAGQWGSALAFAGALFGLDVTVYMVKVSYAASWPPNPTRPGASASQSPRRSKTRRPTPTPSIRWARSSTMSSFTRP